MIHIFLVSLFSFFSAAQDQPKFKERDLARFFTTNMIYPEYSKQNCLQGTVQVAFWLNRKGRISRSQVAKGFGTDLDKEALRLVRLTSGKWTVPAGFDTTFSIVLPVNFTISDDLKCRDRSSGDREAAIAAYRSYENLTRAITNFYENKLAGKYDAAQEARILELKEQLGYTEKYIDRLIKQGNGKLKQGDREGACEDFLLARNLGSEKADKMIAANCK